MNCKPNQCTIVHSHISNRAFKLRKIIDEKCSNNPDLAPKLTEQETIELLPAINDDWLLDSANQTISRNFEFKNYYQTMAFANSCAWIAHQNDHHPDMTVTYRHCNLSFTTHSVDGLSINDFICAAKVDTLLI
ncbi:MAG: 4a-hydroxytetrahydrobiopterin dehydratase [Candidatus Azotimanducaceae bacterium]